VGRTLLLDLDGTLVDTVPDLASALNRLMRARGKPPFSLPQVKGMVGDGVAVLLQRAFRARDTVPDASAAADFMQDYTAKIAVESQVFPGVETVLAEMRRAGWRLAVCTNKPGQAAVRLLEALKLLPLFDAVCGGDTFPVRKPDPGHFLGTLARVQGGTAGRAVMVGDHRNDVLCTVGTGAASIFAAWGYGRPDMAAGAAGVARDIRHAAALAEGLVPNSTGAGCAWTP
jgi:phosphoglycolate phosphatase